MWHTDLGGASASVAHTKAKASAFSLAHFFPLYCLSLQATACLSGTWLQEALGGFRSMVLTAQLLSAGGSGASFVQHQIVYIAAADPALSHSENTESNHTSLSLFIFFCKT